MKFLIDAQLPRRLAGYLKNCGHDVIHTLDLPKKNKTPDKIVRKISIEQKRVVVTKDYDFIDSYVLKKEPFKILLVSTGNITNDALLELFETNLNDLLKELRESHIVELTRNTIVVHF